MTFNAYFLKFVEQPKDGSNKQFEDADGFTMPFGFGGKGRGFGGRGGRGGRSGGRGGGRGAGGR